jgi:hypothetical protein
VLVLLDGCLARSLVVKGGHLHLWAATLLTSQIAVSCKSDVKPHEATGEKLELLSSQFDSA